MGLLIFSIIVVIGLFIGLGFKHETWIETEEETERLWNGQTKTNTVEYEKSAWKWKLRGRQFASVLGLAICLFGMFTKVSANSVGIVYSPFGGTKESTLSEGFHSKGLMDTVYEISTEVQTATVSNLTTQTKDAQFLTTTLDVKYRVSSSNAHLVFKQYRTLEKMSESLIVPTTQRVLEQITTTYNVIDILGEKRNDVYAELEMALTDEFAQYGVEFYSITINDMEAGEAIEKAIEQEAVAKKAVEAAEYNLKVTETEAKEKSVKAQAEQDAAIIEAETKLIEAEAEKKANELLNEALTEEILRKEWIDKWNGEMPKYYAGSEDGASVILDIGESAK